MHSVSRSLQLTINAAIVLIGIAIRKKLMNLVQYTEGNKYRVFNVRLLETDDASVFFISTAIFVILFIALIYYLILLRSSVKDFIQAQIFTSENGRRLKKVARGFLLFVMLYFICSFVLEFIATNINSHQLDNSQRIFPRNKYAYHMGYVLGSTIAKNFALGLLIIFALFFSLIAEVVKEGSLIKSENDLTI